MHSRGQPSMCGLPTWSLLERLPYSHLTNATSNGTEHSGSDLERKYTKRNFKSLCVRIPGMSWLQQNFGTLSRVYFVSTEYLVSHGYDRISEHCLVSTSSPTNTWYPMITTEFRYIVSCLLRLQRILGIPWLRQNFGTLSRVYFVSTNTEVSSFLF